MDNMDEDDDDDEDDQLCRTVCMVLKEFKVYMNPSTCSNECKSQPYMPSLFPAGG